MRHVITHTATVYGETVVDTDVLGAELTDTNTPVLETSVRFKGGAKEFVRMQTGEHVERNPEILVMQWGTDPDTGDRISAADTIEVGMDIEINSDFGTVETDAVFSIESVDVMRGRGNYVEHLKCEVKKHE